MIWLHRRATDIFPLADKDGNGWLSKRELKNVIHKDDDLRYELRTAGGRPWAQFWAELDENNVSCYKASAAERMMGRPFLVVVACLHFGLARTPSWPRASSSCSLSVFWC